MGSVSSLILSTRYRLGDIDETAVSPYQIIEYFNEGYSQLRNIVKDNFPLVIAEPPLIGSTVAGTRSITLPKKPILMVEVRINNIGIDNKPITTVYDKSQLGKPKGFYVTNLTTLNFTPIPDIVYSYEVTYVAETLPLTITDDTNLPYDIDKLLLAYIPARIEGKDKDVVSLWNDQISKLLNDIENVNYTVRGYY
jgi:hypothetical protein